MTQFINCKQGGIGHNLSGWNKIDVLHNNTEGMLEGKNEFK
jgi:hypothetical protein